MCCVHVAFGGIALKDLANVEMYLYLKVECTFVACTFSCSIYICDACFVFKDNVFVSINQALN